MLIFCRHCHPLMDMWLMRFCQAGIWRLAHSRPRLTTKIQILQAFQLQGISRL